MTLEIYKCGTLVRMLGCDITAMIVDVLIKKDCVQYGVAYYNKGDYISVLMIEEQFEAIEPSAKTKLGYK